MRNSRPLLAIALLLGVYTALAFGDRLTLVRGTWNLEVLFSTAPLLLSALVIVGTVAAFLGKRGIGPVLLFAGLAGNILNLLVFSGGEPAQVLSDPLFLGYLVSVDNFRNVIPWTVFALLGIYFVRAGGR